MYIFIVRLEPVDFLDKIDSNEPENGQFSVTERIQNRIAAIAMVADELPGVLIIHSLPDFRVEYMSDRGLKMLGKSKHEIEQMSSEEYHATYFNAEDAADYVPKIQRLLERNTDEVVSFFQQVRTSRTQDFDWYKSAIRILMRDELNRPVLTITLAMKIDPEHHITTKVNRLLDENNFLKKHYHQFSKLTKREQDVLRLLALGNSANEIGEQLFISATTAETHRRNIKQKLKADNFYELSQYARAFDLI